MLELLIQILPQAGQLLRVAQVFGGNDLVMRRRPDPVGVPVVRVEVVVVARNLARARRLVVALVRHVFGVGAVGGAVGVVGLVRLHRFGRNAGVGRIVAVVAALAVALAAALFLLVVVLAVLFPVGRLGVVLQMQVADQLADQPGELVLVLDQVREPVEVPADLPFQRGAREIDHRARGGRRRLAREGLARQIAEHFRQVLFAALGDPVEAFLPAALLVGRGQILAQADHPARADRLAARPLHAIVDLPGHVGARHAADVGLFVVIAQAQGDRIAVAAHFRDVDIVQVARRRRQAHLVAGRLRPVLRKGDVELRLPGNGAHGRAGDLEQNVKRFVRIRHGSRPISRSIGQAV